MESMILEYHEQVKKEFGEKTALCVSCIAALHLSTKIKMKDFKHDNQGSGYTKRIERKFKKLGKTLFLTNEETKFMVDIWYAQVEWNISHTLGDLGGGTKDLTIKQILAK